MYVLLPPDALWTEQAGTILLEGTTQAEGATYRLLAQRTPTPDPLYGVALSTQQAALYLDGVEAPIPGGPISLGQSVWVQLHVHALIARAGQGVYWITLLAGDGWRWGIASAWPVEVAARGLPVYAYTQRLADGTGVVLALTPIESPERGDLRLGDIHLTQGWEGIRRRRDGSPAFVFFLPQEVSGEGEVTIYKGGRHGRATFHLPPWRAAPQADPVWRLPFWLPPDRPPLAYILEGVSRVLSNGWSLAEQVSPDKATGKHLRAHARLFAAPPDMEEEGIEDTTLRLRLKAIPEGRFASIPALRSHLKKLAPGISISDAQSIEGRPLRLDGTWQINGVHKLGGDGGPSMPPGEYLVSIYDAPLPWTYYWRELQRLRPAGLRPHLRWEASAEHIRLGVSVVGAKEPRGLLSRTSFLPQRLRLNGTWQLDGSKRLTGHMVLRTHFQAPLRAHLKTHAGDSLHTASGEIIEVEV